MENSSAGVDSTRKSLFTMQRLGWIRAQEGGHAQEGRAGRTRMGWEVTPRSPVA